MTYISKSKKLLELSENITNNCIGKSNNDGKDICKKCISDCEMLEEYVDTPKTFFQKVLNGEEIDKIVPFSCTACDKCLEVCPKDLDLSTPFMEMRREIVKENNGKVPLKGYGGVDIHQKLSFSKFMNTTRKSCKLSKIKRSFMPGCSLPSYRPDLIEKILTHIKERDPEIDTVLKCCGKPTELIGQEELFNKRFSALEKEFEELETEEVIVACQNCYRALKENSKIKVKSLWTYLEEIGLPEKSKEVGKESDIIFSIHDSCPTRNETKIHSSIRWIMGELGYQVEEMKNSGTKTKCCGVGGMVASGNFPMAKKMIETRCSESKTDHIVSYCASCTNALSLGGKNSYHILELIFQDTLYKNTERENKSPSGFESWKNRYSSKKIINKIYK